MILKLAKVGCFKKTQDDKMLEDAKCPYLQHAQNFKEHFKLLETITSIFKLI